ncbi:MAG: CBS domain-containing protein [Chloroflexi bacterium]|nr:CBS domain-containing protein [Chloroflexota bacterium]
MSARAAWRLQTLGFDQVYRFKPGRQAWFAYGLPLEGQMASSPRAGDVVRRDVPLCHLHEQVGDVWERIRRTGWNQCIVVDGGKVVLGRLGRAALKGDSTATVEEVMTAGPATVRPNQPLAELVARMRTRRVGSIVVTDPDGRLVGILFRRDAEQQMTRHAGNGRKDLPPSRGPGGTAA